MITYRGLISLLIMSMSIAVPVKAADDMATHMLVDTCVACHGPGGSSYGPAIPTIGGMSEDSFLYAMEMYQTGERKGTIMNRIAKGYTEADFQVMASYFMQ
jgi:sulfide dehydrogenase cytochrome subunit